MKTGPAISTPHANIEHHVSLAKNNNGDKRRLGKKRRMRVIERIRSLNFHVIHYKTLLFCTIPYVFPRPPDNELISGAFIPAAKAISF